MVSATPPSTTNGGEYTSWPTWSCEAKPSPSGVFQESKWWESRPGVGEERCYITEGRAMLHINMNDEASESKVITIAKGDWVTFKAGFQCRWEVEEPISKNYSYFNKDGSAWNPLDHSETTDTSNMSKKALKRLRRQEVWKQQKVMKREKQRTKRQEKAAERRLLKEQEGDEEVNSEKKEAHTDGDGNMTNDSNKETRVERKKKIQDQFLYSCSQNFSIIVDCAWESYHSDRALTSLGQQLMFCYGETRKATHPSTLYYTGVGPKLMEKLKNTHCDNWVGVHVVPEREYTDMEEYFYKDEDDGEDGGVKSQVPPAETSESNDTKGDGGISKGECDNGIQKKQLIYLTSDATETLKELDPNHAYIIGGIVDRNKYKKASYNKAVAQEVKTYSLPIRENIQMGMTHVLTVNHVVHLLLEKGCKGSADEKTWKEALEVIIPTRKVVDEEEACEGEQKETIEAAEEGKGA